MDGIDLVCHRCVKLVVTFASPVAIETLLHAPNTYDQDQRRYNWHRYDCIDYALVPRVLHGDGVQVDLYLCMNEDDLDDIELPRFLARFIEQRVMLEWPRFDFVRLSEPIETPPADVGCRRSSSGVSVRAR